MTKVNQASTFLTCQKIDIGGTEPEKKNTSSLMLLDHCYALVFYFCYNIPM